MLPVLRSQMPMAWKKAIISSPIITPSTKAEQGHDAVIFPKKLSRINDGRGI
jgi:hypothetical protein